MISLQNEGYGFGFTVQETNGKSVAVRTVVPEGVAYKVTVMIHSFIMCTVTSLHYMTYNVKNELYPFRMVDCGSMMSWPRSMERKCLT